MSSEQLDPVDRPRTSRGRLRRSGQSMLRVGLLLLAIALVVTLVSGLATRSLLDNLRSNSSELMDGTATLTLDAGQSRALYVTGGLVAPGEDLPTPVEEITCTVTGPDGGVPVSHLKDEDRRVGVDNPLARFQIVGSFRTTAAGEHQIDCSGLGVVVAPEISPASALMRLGGLMLGSLGVFAGFTLALIGGAITLIVRHGTDEEDDDGYDVGVGEPPAEGADEWWEDENAQAAARDHAHTGTDTDIDTDADGVERVVPLTGERRADQEYDDDELIDEQRADDEQDDDYVQLTDEELSELSEEEIGDLLRSGALVYVDEDGNVLQPDESAPVREERGDTYR